MIRFSPATVQAAAAKFGVPAESLRYLGGMDGAAYEYEQGGRLYVLKLAPSTPERLPLILAKLDFVRFLGVRGVSLSRPVASVGGDLLDTVGLGEGDETGGEDERIAVVTSSEKAIGWHAVRERADGLRPPLIREWGRVLGQMHRLATDYPDADALPGWRAEYESMVALCADAAVAERWQEMGERLGRLPESPDAYGAIHNDLHQYNFVVAGPDESPRITLFDFDVCHRHFFAAELGLALFHALWEGPAERTRDRRAFAAEFVEHLRAGYETEYRLAGRWWQELPTFLEYRRLLLYTVFAPDWSHDNEWRRHQLKTWRDGIVSGEPVVI